VASFGDRQAHTPPAPAACRARERRTLRAAPVSLDSARWGRVTQPAPWWLRPARRRRWRLTCVSVNHSTPSRQLTSSCSLVSTAARSRSRKLAFWSALKARQLGVTFRRQVPVGGQFIADFLAPSLRLIVEVDGGYHARRRRADERRELKLRRLGFRVVRMNAELVLNDLSAAVALVRAAL
jgi:very-short-patch-repair endonuclease